MTRFDSNCFGWLDSPDGLKLTVRTPAAKFIAEGREAGKLYTVEIREYRKKRSLNANSYYWLLLGKLAEKLREPTPYLHNIMLREYGQLERYDGKNVYVVLPDTGDAEKKADLSETYHIKPTSQTKYGNDGQVYRTWMLLRGSSTYDSAEMARLIDGLIEECKAQGIETMTPEELARLEGYGK